MREKLVEMLAELVGLSVASEWATIETWASRHRTWFKIRANRLLEDFEVHVKRPPTRGGRSYTTYNRWSRESKHEIERRNAESEARYASGNADARNSAKQRLEAWLQGIIDVDPSQEELTEPEAGPKVLLSGVSHSQVILGKDNVQETIK